MVYICACGLTFESSQLKAAHCKYCNVYQVQRGLPIVNRKSASPQQSSSHQKKQHSTPNSSLSQSQILLSDIHTTVSTSSTPITTITEPIIPIPSLINQTTTTTTPIPTVSPLHERLKQTISRQKASPLSFKPPNTANRLSLSSLQKNKPTQQYISSSAIQQRLGVCFSKIIERLEQDNYIDPNSAPHLSMATPKTMVEICEGGNIIDEESEEADEDLSTTTTTQDGEPSAKKRKKSKSKRNGGGGGSANKRKPMPNLSLGRALDEIDVVHENNGSQNVPSWINSMASAPMRPRRWFCCICGSQGCYKCIKCGLRFCSTGCNKAHQDTRCLKYVR